MQLSNGDLKNNLRYDALNRLTIGSEGSYAYDANEDRTGAPSGAYMVASASNCYVVDPDGAMTLDAAATR